MDNQKRQEWIEIVKKYLAENNIKPDAAYYYDGCELTFSTAEGLRRESFDYWEENMLVGKNVLENEYIKALNECGISNIGVFPMEFWYDSIDYDEDMLFEYFIDDLDTFKKMSLEEKKSAYQEMLGDN